MRSSRQPCTYSFHQHLRLVRPPKHSSLRYQRWSDTCTSCQLTSDTLNQGALKSTSSLSCHLHSSILNLPPSFSLQCQKLLSYDVASGQIGHEEICQRRSSQNEQSAGSTSSRNWRACSTHSTQSWSDCVALSEPFSLTVVIVSSSSEAREGPATPFHLQSEGATWPSLWISNEESKLPCHPREWRSEAGTDGRRGC